MSITAVHKQTGESREIGYLRDLAPMIKEGWTAGDEIDKAARRIQLIENGKEKTVDRALPLKEKRT